MAEGLRPDLSQRLEQMKDHADVIAQGLHSVNVDSESLRFLTECTCDEKYVNGRLGFKLR